MNHISTLDQIEQQAKELGLGIEELFAEAKVAYSNRSRWLNKKTTPNFSTLNKLEGVIKRKKSKVNKKHISN